MDDWPARERWTRKRFLRSYRASVQDDDDETVSGETNVKAAQAGPGSTSLSPSSSDSVRGEAAGGSEAGDSEAEVRRS